MKALAPLCQEELRTGGREQPDSNQQPRQEELKGKPSRGPPARPRCEGISPQQPDRKQNYRQPTSKPPGPARVSIRLG